jgi:hypothetical protein
MTTIAAPPRLRGQAVVEHVGLVAVVAIVLAAATVWLVPALRPPALPPGAVERVAVPLVRAAEPPRAAPSPAPPTGAPPAAASGPAAPPGSGHGSRGLVGRVWGGVTATVGFVEEAGDAFAAGVRSRVGQRIEEVLRHPLRTAVGAVRGVVEVVSDPVGVAEANLQAVERSVDELRRRPLRDAVIVLSRRLGEQVADVGIGRLSRVATRSLARRVHDGRRQDAGPPPAAPIRDGQGTAPAHLRVAP